MKKYKIKEKTVRIFEDNIENKKVPTIFVNTVMNEGQKVFDECKNLGVKDFILVEIAGIDWDSDMTPWPMEAISKNDTPCLGKANEHLDFLLNDVISLVQQECENQIEYNIIAGYSLAGLFAFYSLYKTNVFEKAVCGSASFWYKDFVEFVENNKIKIIPKSVYFSLGDKESKTNNPILQTVEQNTLKIKEHCDKLSIKSVFEINAGGHFTEANNRMARGIKWILEN